MKTIYLGADHAGFQLKEKIKHWLKAKKISYDDLGNVVYDPNDDYPLYAAKVARKVVQKNSKGILICGSAEGVCIAANKVKGIRAVNPHSLLQTRLSREHEDANILCLAGGGSQHPQPGISLVEAGKVIKVFLHTPFSQQARHKRRIKEIKRLER
ncbi:RpiB/LacA/LacB family sugar-phosphate isomerase [Candidatus Woesearchaeota archaeon]|nr:RpiB/LacA/LacB family sugar-phosphate isomerase [Candidatus Woesearchaeota archaeon]